MTLRAALVFAALFAFGLSPRSAAADAVTHQYVITGGFDGGPFGSGLPIVGGQFALSYPSLTCPTPCSGAVLLSFNLQVSTASAGFGFGSFTLGYQSNQGARHDVSGASSFRSGAFLVPVLGSITFAGSWPTGASSRPVSGEFVLFSPLTRTATFVGHEVQVPEPGSSALLLTGALVVGAVVLRRRLSK